jgi:hypothetical protein
MPTPIQLTWDEIEATDFNYFTVYGSSTPGLDSTATVICHTVETETELAVQFDYYHVTATDFAGNESDASSLENAYAGVNSMEDLPTRFELKPNRPNPFESGTVISFDLPEPCLVRLEIVDVQGRVVRLLIDKAWGAGRHSVVWTGENDSGANTGPGVYFVQIKAGNFTARNKVLHMR